MPTVLVSPRDPIPLGFTFSFPVVQTALDAGTIVAWNKDFQCDDVIGLDPVILLPEAIEAIVRARTLRACTPYPLGRARAHALGHPARSHRRPGE